MRFERKRVPNVAGNFGVHTVNLLATTLNDPVKADVVLKRIGANNVIVVRIDNTNRNSPCLVDTTGNGLEAYGDLDVLRDDRLEDGEREPIISSIGARLLNDAAPEEVESLTTAHLLGAPWPVRANLKPVGAAPTSIFAMAMTVAADCDRPSEPEAATTTAPITAAANSNSMIGDG